MTFIFFVAFLKIYDKVKKTSLSSENSSIPNSNTATPCVNEPKKAMFLELSVCPTTLKADAAINPES